MCCLLYTSLADFFIVEEFSVGEFHDRSSEGAFQKACLVDQENSHLSRQLLTALESSDSLHVTDYVTSEEDVYKRQVMHSHPCL